MTTSTVVHITFEQYLATEYHPDREWIDGELRERNVGKFEHARVQYLLALWMGQNEEKWGIIGTTEQRVQVSPNRVRIPDLTLLEKGPQPPIATDPPVLVVEILSPGDSYADTQERAQDYRAMGVKTVWLIDPTTRTGRMCVDHAALGEDTWIKASVLVVPGTTIHVDLDHLFAKLQ
jgi:Uma2 family endonuclease